MRTLAHQLVEKRYVELGETTRIVVLPLTETGLPQHLVDPGQPVPLDLLAGRPVNLVLDEEGLSADLCFQGPPVRCRFPWEAVIAVQDPSGNLVQTLVVTVATVMADESIKPTSPENLMTLLSNPHSPSVAVIDGGGGAASVNPRPDKPKLKLVDTAWEQNDEVEP